MIFTTGQLFGIAAFTAAVLVVGALLYKLDKMIGTNYDTADSGQMAESPSAPLEVAPADSPGASRQVSRATSHRRKRRH